MSIEKKTWKEFTDNKLLWYVNRMLHIFGWAIVIKENDEGHVVEAYPARTKWRGFDEKTNEEGYIGLAEYMEKEGIQLVKEAKGEPEEEITEDTIHMGKDLDVDSVLNIGIPQSYKNMQLFKTKCGKHFIGYCRGDEWYYKSNHQGHFELLPDEFEVKGWVTLE